MQHFQSILIVIGIIAIAGVLIHAYFTGRKEKEAEAETISETPDMFAETGGPETAEVAKSETVDEVQSIHHDNALPETDTIDFSQALNNEQVEPVEFNEMDPEHSFLVDTVKEEVVSPEVAIQDEERIEIETPLAADIEPLVVPEVKEEKVVQPADLFIFNVAAKEGQLLGGHVLLQFFLTSGFRFGEMAIFHRHENSDGTGPILFSIANMMAPGEFDPDTMEQFKSEGVSFFLTVPNENIDIKASFEMMLRAVEQMAEEFDCVVLNADREIMTEAQFLDYRNRLLHYI